MSLNACIWCIFGSWIEISFQNFSITQTFRSWLKDWNLLRQDTKLCFTVGAMTNSRLSSPLKIVSCLQWCLFPLCKFLAKNITQTCGVRSLLRQKWAWRWFYSTTEIDSPPFLWLMQLTWREVIKAWSYCWEILIMTNLSGSYVVISRLWHCYAECNLGTQNTAVFCAKGTGSTRRITM